MDPNPAPTTVPPVVPSQPEPPKAQVIPPPLVNPSATPPGPSHKLSLPMLIVTVVVLILAVGGVFAYRMYIQNKPNNVSVEQKIKAQDQMIVTPNDQTPSVIPTPADDISGIDNSLKSVDSDLSNADLGLNDKPDNLTP